VHCITITTTTERILIMNGAQVVIDYLIEHLLHKERTAMGSEPNHPADAAMTLEWYRRADVADPGIDPTRILQCVPTFSKQIGKKLLWP
jgi:hypothetical protein